MNIGLLGASRVAIYAVIEPAKALPDCGVFAIAARDADRAQAYASAHDIPRVHPTYEALIGDPEIDLIYVGTPPHNHAELACRAIDAGKALLVEKPFAMDAHQADAVFEHASKAGVPVFEAMHSLHHALFHRVQALLSGRAVGEVTRIAAHFDAPIVRSAGEFRWHSEFGGGALMDLGVYPLAWCRHLVGEAFQVEHAVAQIDGVDTRFEAKLRFAGGIEANIGSRFDAERHRATLCIEGSLGRIEIENFVGPHRGHRLQLIVADRITEETVPGPTTYEAQLAAVRASVVDGVPFPLPPDDYVCSMRAIEQVRKALLAEGI
jgi:predicted dehydrogenase